MANWNTLKTAVANVINANGNQAITGQLLQNVLNNIITNVGENATFAGIATLDTNPGVPDGPVFYLTATAGTYPNFNGTEVQDGEAVILLWNNNAWSKKITGFATQEKLSELGSKIGEINQTLTITTSSLNFYVYSKFKAGDILKVKVTSNNVVIDNNKINLYESNISDVAATIKLNDDYAEFMFTKDSEYVRLFKNIGAITTTGSVQISIICNHAIRLENLESEMASSAESLKNLSKSLSELRELESKVGEYNDIYTVPSSSSLSYVFNYPFKKGDILKIKVTTDDVSTQNNFVNVIDSSGSVLDSIILNSDYKQVVLPNDTDYIQIFRNVNAIVTTGTIQIHIVCNHEIRLEKLEEKSIIQEGEINRLNENTKNVLPSNQESDESGIVITDNDDKFIGAWKRDGLHVVGLFIQEDEKDENPKNIKDLVGGNNEVDNEIIASKKLFKLEGNVVFDTNTHLFSLAHISDIHTDRVRYEYFLNFIKRSEIDDAICTGDFAINNTASEWQTIFEGNPNDGVIKVVGNHDAQSGMSDTDIANFMGLDSLYYYKDLQTYQGAIRLIVVNQFDVNGLDNAEKSATFHYSQEQINWFVATLKNAQSLGYPVIVALHTPETRPTPNEKGFYQRYFDLDNMFNNYLCEGTPIEDIINAFQNGVGINETYTYKDTSATISVNTSFEQGVFIAYLAGHVHADLHGVSSKYADQLYLCETCGCLKVGSKDYGNRYSDLHRIEGDESENSFNVYSFDLWQKKIKVVRVGARMNDLLENRKCVVFDYK